MELVNVVKAVEGKYGPQLLDDQKRYYSFSKRFKGPTNVNPGAYSMDIFMSEKGNRYINKLEAIGTVDDLAEVAVAPVAEVKVARKAKVVVSQDKPRDFDKENRGKVKSLFLEALLSNPNVMQADVVGVLQLLNSSEIQAELDKLVETVF